MKLCRHCKTRIATRARQMCPTCYNDPAIRALVPPILFVVGDHFGGYDLPSEPTSAMPGTEDKIRVLQDRAARNVALWHPLDAADYGRLSSFRFAQ